MKRVRDWSTAEGVRERWDCPVTPGNDRADEWSGSGSAESPAAAKLTQRPNEKEETMTQEERRLYLINELLKEDKGSAGFKLGLVPEKEGGFVIPDDEKSQRDLLRSLMNFRLPLPERLPHRFL